MKKIMISLACIIISIFCFGQYDEVYGDDVKGEKLSHFGAKKGDNLMIINTDRNQDENFIMMGNYLASKGYTFELTDQKFHALVTSSKIFRRSMNYKLFISFVDSSIYLRVKRSGMSTGSALVFWDAEFIYINWHFTNRVTSSHYKAFNDFYPVLQGYGYPIRFSKE